MSAIAYFTALEMVRAHPDVPVGAIASAWGGTMMEPWMPPDALQACAHPPADLPSTTPSPMQNKRNADPGLYSPGRHPALELQVGPPNMHSTLWNSMLAPLTSLRVSAWYWYQGESNANSNMTLYSACFSAMITSWRQHWGQPAAPFIFFQLAPWPALDTGIISATRQAQTSALLLPSVGMVVAADRGDSAGAFHPIHPPVKEELSHRAFLVTDSLLYKNASSPRMGPQPVKAIFDAWSVDWGDYHYGTGAGSYVCLPGSNFACGGIRVVFDQPLSLASTWGDRNSLDNGLVLWDEHMQLFQRAEITGVRVDDPHTLQLNITWAFGKKPPVLLQYAHSDYPNMPLYNAFELPTPPFSISIASLSK